jgi:hypothetical protein
LKRCLLLAGSALKIHREPKRPDKQTGHSRNHICATLLPSSEANSVTVLLFAKISAWIAVQSM